MVPLYYSKISMVPTLIPIVPPNYVLITTVFFFPFLTLLPALLPWLLHFKPDNDQPEYAESTSCFLHSFLSLPS